MIHDINLEEALFDEYRKMNLGSSSFCVECNEKINDLSLPSTIWGVGKDFKNSEYKVLFVGKNARGNPGYKVDSANFLDCRDMGNELWNKKWAYFSYIKSIAERIYPNSGINSIAFTNIIKCNNTWDETQDTTNEFQKNNCIKNFGVIKKEIEVLKPQKIVFLTSWYYDTYIDSIFKKITITEDTKKQIGKKKMPWKNFCGFFGSDQIKSLRVGHPERMKKVDFVDEISKWIASP